MNYKTYSLNIEFCMFRILTDNTGINTSIVSNYRLLTIPHNDFPKALKEITIDLNNLANKYQEKYKLELNE